MGRTAKKTKGPLPWWCVVDYKADKTYGPFFSLAKASKCHDRITAQPGFRPSKRYPVVTRRLFKI